MRAARRHLLPPRRGDARHGSRTSPSAIGRTRSRRTSCARCWSKRARTKRHAITVSMVPGRARRRLLRAHLRRRCRERLRGRVPDPARARPAGDVLRRADARRDAGLRHVGAAPRDGRRRHGGGEPLAHPPVREHARSGRSRARVRRVEAHPRVAPRLRRSGAPRCRAAGSRRQCATVLRALGYRVVLHQPRRPGGIQAAIRSRCRASRSVAAPSSKSSQPS